MALKDLAGVAITGAPRTGQEKREREFSEAIGNHLTTRYGATLLAGHYTSAWTLETRAGLLRITPVGGLGAKEFGFLALRFEDASRAVALLPGDAIWPGRLNRFSGKWNIDGMDRTATVVDYITELDRKLAQVLPKAAPESNI